MKVCDILVHTVVLIYSLIRGFSVFNKDLKKKSQWEKYYYATNRHNIANRSVDFVDEKYSSTNIILVDDKNYAEMYAVSSLTRRD